MKKALMTLVLSAIVVMALAQDEEEKSKVPFKENLFTGGSVSLAFFNNTFLIGGNPVFGYSLTDWADAGVVVNYTYTSYRDYNFVANDKLRQTVYGGGAFVKLYPVRFLFLQAQYEYNFIRQKYIQGGTSYTETARGEAPSLLVGGGYTSGREGRGGEPFYYLAVLFDVNRNILSPYTDEYNRIIPIIRAGLQIPLFQGSEPRGRR